MKRKNFNPEALHTPFANYVHGITIDEANRVLFIAGQVPANKEGDVVGTGDFNAQGDQVMRNLKEVLKRTRNFQIFGLRVRSAL